MKPFPGLGLFAVAALLSACSPSESAKAAAEATASTPAATVAAVTDQATRRERGEYLVTTFACNDCHTPFHMGANGPEPDMTRMLSGHPETLIMPPPPELPEGPWLWIGAATNTAFAGPWGVSFAINLTPDPSGLAGLDAESFLRAMRTGTHYGTSRPILPPMPWQWLSRMTDEDLLSIFAYLQSIPPVVNHVPEPVPPPAAPAG